MRNTSYVVFACSLSNKLSFSVLCIIKVTCKHELDLKKNALDYVLKRVPEVHVRVLFFLNRQLYIVDFFLHVL